MIIQTAIQTTDGTFLRTENPTSYVYKVDGHSYTIGINYLLTSNTSILKVESPFDLKDSDSIEKISNNLLWGVREGEKVTLRLLKYLETSHLKNIAKLRPTIWVLMSIFYILEKREELWNKTK
jgi:hypothetical protein